MVTDEHAGDDAECKEEEDFSVIVAGGWVVGEDERDDELEEVAEGKCHPVVTIDALSDLFAENEQRYVGEDHHQPAQTH